MAFIIFFELIHFVECFGHGGLDIVSTLISG